MADYDSGTVSFVDPNRDMVTATVPVGQAPQGLSFSADGRWLYVVDGNNPSFSVIDCHTLKVTATLPLGIEPTSVAAAPSGRIYVTDSTEGTVTVLRLTARTTSSGGTDG